MLSLRIETLVAGLVRQLLAVGNNDAALHFHFDCRMSARQASPTIEFRASRGLHLLYQKNINSSYINVFSAVLKSTYPYLDKIDKVESWKHESSHDSSWRDISTFSNVYFGMADEINDAFGAAGRSSMAPIDMHEYNSFGALGNDRVFSWVPVKISKDPTDRNNYRKIVSIVKA